MEKPIRITRENRLEIVNNILSALFNPKIAALRADMTARATAIGERVYARFLELYANKDDRHYLDYSTGHKFSFRARENGELKSEEHLTFPKLYLTEPHSYRAQLAKMGVGEERYSNREQTNGEHVVVLAPKRVDIPVLNENERRAVRALQRRAKALQDQFNVAREQIFSAVNAHKTVKSFYDEFPEFEKMADVPAFATPLPAGSMALVLSRETVLGTLKQAGLLPLPVPVAEAVVA
ncbi:hypothetical protein [Achromobacter sp. AGC39]